MPRLPPRSVAIGLMVVTVAVSGCRPRQVALPQADQLAQHAVIRRDTFGIPHILADTEEAAAFALGYAQAEDHAADIGRRYLRARGQEAMHFGASGIENDFDMAQFDNLGEAERGLETLSPLFGRIVTAFAAGVNRYVERNRSSLPAWMPQAPTDRSAASAARSGDRISDTSCIATRPACLS